MSWTKVTYTDSIPLREGRCVEFGRKEIAIFRLPDKFLAVDNRCPHNQGPLCDGMVTGQSVVCPLHGWKVCLDSGRVTRPDVPVGVRTYPVRVVDGIIEIQLSSAKEKDSEQEEAA